VPGEVTSMEFTPTEVGTFEINCGMNMMEPGYVIVTQ
jgi:plastocyanin domain-containing protein